MDDERREANEQHAKHDQVESRGNRQNPYILPTSDDPVPGPSGMQSARSQERSVNPQLPLTHGPLVPQDAWDGDNESSDSDSSLSPFSGDDDTLEGEDVEEPGSDLSESGSDGSHSQEDSAVSESE